MGKAIALDAAALPAPHRTAGPGDTRETVVLHDVGEQHRRRIGGGPDQNVGTPAEDIAPIRRGFDRRIQSPGHDLADGFAFVAVGLLYRRGYFRQVIDPSGWQREEYPELREELTGLHA